MRKALKMCFARHSTENKGTRKAGDRQEGKPKEKPIRSESTAGCVDCPWAPVSKGQRFWGKVQWPREEACLFLPSGAQAAETGS